jgi:hypothetical protein
MQLSVGFVSSRKLLELTGRFVGPAPKCVPEIGRIAEPERERNIFALHVGIAKIFDGKRRPQLIKKLAKRCVLRLQLALHPFATSAKALIHSGHSPKRIAATRVGAGPTPMRRSSRSTIHFQPVGLEV